VSVKARNSFSLLEQLLASQEGLWCGELSSEWCGTEKQLQRKHFICWKQTNRRHSNEIRVKKFIKIIHRGRFVHGSKHSFPIGHFIMLCL
jgi:hypothetical protein